MIPRCLRCTAPAAFNCFDALLCASHFVEMFNSPLPSANAAPVSSRVTGAEPAVELAPAAAGSFNKTTKLRVAALSAIQESVSSSMSVPSVSMIGEGHGAIVDALTKPLEAHNTVVRGG